MHGGHAKNGSQLHTHLNWLYEQGLLFEHRKYKTKTTFLFSVVPFAHNHIWTGRECGLLCENKVHDTNNITRHSEKFEWPDCIYSGSRVERRKAIPIIITIVVVIKFRMGTTILIWIYEWLSPTTKHNLKQILLSRLNLSLSPNNLAFSLGIQVNKWVFAVTSFSSSRKTNKFKIIMLTLCKVNRGWVVVQVVAVISRKHVVFALVNFGFFHEPTWESSHMLFNKGIISQKDHFLNTQWHNLF